MGGGHSAAADGHHKYNVGLLLGVQHMVPTDEHSNCCGSGTVRHKSHGTSGVVWHCAAAVL